MTPPPSSPAVLPSAPSGTAIRLSQPRLWPAAVGVIAVHSGALVLLARSLTP